MNILIGSKHKEEFKSIFRLIKDCKDAFREYSADGDISSIDSCTDGSLYVADRNNRYYYDKNTYDVRYRDTEIGEATVTEGFYADGASWFRCFRDKEFVSSAISQWFNFIEQVAIVYHQKYSIVEYKQRRSESKDIDVAYEEAQPLIKQLFGVNLPRRGFTQVSEDSSVDIYMLSLRLAMDGGAGESVRILGKVYFQEKKSLGVSYLIPIPVIEARSIDESFSKLNKDEDKEDTREPVAMGDVNAVRNNALNALQNLVNSAVGSESLQAANGGKNFVDYLLYSEEDGKIIDEMLQQTLHGQSDLTCRELKVLGISHFVWNISAFDCKFDGTPNIRVIFGINGTKSLKCLACSTVQDEQYIVKNDEILLKPEAPCKSVPISRMDEEENAKLIEEFGVHKDHLKKVECRNIGLGETCTCYRCENDIFTAEFAGRERAFCTKCHRPEVITLKGGEPMLTSNMRFSVTELRMVPKEETVQCEYCGRYINARSDSKCPGVCGKIADLDPSSDEETLAEARRCYKKYVGSVPLFSRMKKTGKYAVEDAGVVMLKIGENVFKFDKMHLNDKGRLKSAINVLKK